MALRKDYEFTDIGKHLQNRLKQKQRTGMSVASFMLHHLRQYAIYPDEMSVKFDRGILKIKLIDKEDKTAWFHKREQYRNELNTKLHEMNYQVVINSVRIVGV